MEGWQRRQGVGQGKSNEADGFKLPTKKRRIQCLYFRIMLPNLGGRRPQRDISWTFSCMRSIMFAKQIDDSICKRTAGLFPLRIRMPEFVNAWFSPWKPLKDEKKSQKLIRLTKVQSWTI